MSGAASRPTGAATPVRMSMTSWAVWSSQCRTRATDTMRASQRGLGHYPNRGPRLDVVRHDSPEEHADFETGSYNAPAR